MNARQLIAALQKLHPDFQDQDLVVIGMDKKGELTYELVAGAGIGIKEDVSFAMITTEKAVKQIVKGGNARRMDTNEPLTDKDLEPPKEDES